MFVVNKLVLIYCSQDSIMSSNHLLKIHKFLILIQYGRLQSRRQCTQYFKWPSMYRVACLIYNCTPVCSRINKIFLILTLKMILKYRKPALYSKFVNNKLNKSVLNWASNTLNLKFIEIISTNSLKLL